MARKFNEFILLTCTFYFHAISKFTNHSLEEWAITRLSTIGDRAFPVTAARLWNALPLNVTSASSISFLGKHLKTHAFSHSFLESPVVSVQWIYHFGHYNRSCYLFILSPSSSSPLSPSSPSSTFVSQQYSNILVCNYDTTVAYFFLFAAFSVVVISVCVGYGFSFLLVIFFYYFTHYLLLLILCVLCVYNELIKWPNNTHKDVKLVTMTNRSTRQPSLLICKIFLALVLT